MGTASTEIVNGSLDSGNTRPYVVRLQGCTGVLVSPYWVMTARHCFEDPPDTLDELDNFSVKLAFDPGTVPNLPTPSPFRYDHFFSVSGEVLNLDDNIVGIAPADWEIARDIAVFRLDVRVPRAIARPRNPSLVADSCPDGFEGTLVGFGESWHDESDDQKACDDGAGTVRRSSVVGGWHRTHTFPLGSVYKHDWVFPVITPCKYNGFGSGDSGGPVFDANGQLCGVMSVTRLFPLFFPDPFGAYWDLEGVIGGVDSAAAIGLLSRNTSKLQSVIDAKGNFDGECARYVHECDDWNNPAWCTFLESKDADGDLILDVCDNCPSVYNPGQVISDDDVDNNGWGSACDFCPFQDHDGAGPVGNCNYETELVNAYTGATTPPVLGPTSTMVQRQKFLAAFRPDVCDDVPCPRTAVIKKGFSFPPEMLPPIEFCPTGNPPPGVSGCNCTFPPLGSCGWDVEDAKTTLQMKPWVNEAFSAHDHTTSVRVGFRFCPCMFNTETAAGRLMCQTMFACNPNQSAYDFGATWKQIKTEPDDKWASCITQGVFDPDPPCSDLGREFIMTLLELGQPGFKLEVRWNFQALPEVMDTFKQIPMGGVIKRELRGVLLSKIVRVGNLKVGSTFFPRYFERAQALQSGHQLMELVTDAQTLEKKLSWKNFSSWIKAWWNNCPDEKTPVATFGDDARVWAISSEGTGSVLEPPPGMRDLFEQARTGQVIFVPAAEALGTLATQSLPGMGFLRAVTVDPATPQVVQALESANIDGLASVSGRSPCGVDCSPAFSGNEGLVLSGTLRRLLVVGGTGDGSDTGTPHASAWLLDVDLNEWTELPLEPDDRPASVLAATYRAGDLSAYMVDSDGSHVLLHRFMPRGALTPLAEFPGAWDKYLGSAYLVVGERGDIVLAASKADDGKVAVCHAPPGKPANTKTLHVSLSDAEAHVGHGDAAGPCPGDELEPGAPARAILARFTVDGSGALSFEGMKELGTRILGPPIVEAGTITVTVRHASGAVLRSIAVGELTMPPPSQSPTIL